MRESDVSPDSKNALALPLDRGNCVIRVALVKGGPTIHFILRDLAIVVVHILVHGVGSHLRIGSRMLVPNFVYS